MKRIFAVAALVASLFLANSCVEMKGDFIYDLKVSFFDNFDVLTRGFDKAFEEAGCRMEGSYWMLSGEKNACDSKVKNAFLARAKDIDLNREAQEGLIKYLDLKGETITLTAQWGSEKYELGSYTFTK